MALGKGNIGEVGVAAPSYSTDKAIKRSPVILHSSGLGPSTLQDTYSYNAANSLFDDLYLRDRIGRRNDSGRVNFTYGTIADDVGLSEKQVGRKVHDYGQKPLLDAFNPIVQNQSGSNYGIDALLASKYTPTDHTLASYLTSDALQNDKGSLLGRLADANLPISSDPKTLNDTVEFLAVNRYMASQPMKERIEYAARIAVSVGADYKESRMLFDGLVVGIALDTTGSTSAAAKYLDISERHMQRLVSQFDVDPARGKTEEQILINYIIPAMQAEQLRNEQSESEQIGPKLRLPKIRSNLEPLFRLLKQPETAPLEDEIRRAIRLAA